MRYAVPLRLLLALLVCAVQSAGASGAGAKVHFINVREVDFGSVVAFHERRS